MMSINIESHCLTSETPENARQSPNAIISEMSDGQEKRSIRPLNWKDLVKRNIGTVPINLI